MPVPTTFVATVSRRQALYQLCAAALLSGGSLPTAHAQTSNTQHAIWRATTRLGYGPTPALLSAAQAASSPRDWALQQLDAAYRASQRPPLIAPELADFAAPLPTLFAKARAERESRKKNQPQPRDNNERPNRREMLDAMASGESVAFSRSVSLQATAWRLRSCSQPEDENPLLARMTEFWFNHLNVYAGKGAVRPFTGHYALHVARAHALGRFEDLLLASARHPAMLLYLDQAQSVAEGTRGAQGTTRGLNENYARELLELHTLGVNGGYTQTDVRALARVLTGWTIDPRAPSGFRFVARTHDSGPKTVLGQHFGSGQGTGEQEGIDAIRMLARHPSTAQRVCTRLAQYFVSDTPEAALVAQLVRTFTATQGDLRAVMRSLLESADFWLPHNTLFKTPMDYACSVLAATQGAQDPKHLLLAAAFLNQAGQPVHGWQTPDGYAFDAATWAVPEALTRRTDFALALARQADTEFLLPYLSATTRHTIAQERPALRAGLMLASPDFMRK